MVNARNFRLFGLLVPMFMIAGCSARPLSHPDRPELFGTGYRAAGNEPFWTLLFSSTTIDFSMLGDEHSVRAPIPEAQRTPDGWRFSTTVEGRPFVLVVRDRPCSDSMSGRPFPHTVELTVNGQAYSGCGGDTRSLLPGDGWRVTSLEGNSASRERPPTLLFGTDGSLTGNGGCNNFRSTYEITGEGIVIGPALATRMACADPQANRTEVRFFELLERVTRFDIAPDGQLILLIADRPLIRAERYRDSDGN